MSKKLKKSASSYSITKKKLVSNPLKLSDYNSLTFVIYRQIAWIKCQFFEAEYHEIPQSQKIDFKFKKSGYNKLVIFDVDETLIHCRRDKDENNQEAEDFKADEEISVQDPCSG